MTTTTAPLFFFSDPGHGWLQVARTEMEALGIADKISRYSYQKGEFVYLEEDVDAGIFICAYAEAHGHRPAVVERDDSMGIRRYGRYRARTGRSRAGGAR